MSNEASAAANGSAEDSKVPAANEQGGGIYDPNNFQHAHPLQNRWVLWFDNPGRKTSQQSWGDHLRQINTFGSVEDFWRLYNNISPASALGQGSNYHLFKEGIEPKWEDLENKRGGKWVVQFPSKQRREHLDQRWLFTMLALIGETMEASDDICGAVVSIRKSQDKIAIWTKDQSPDFTRAIGKSFKRTLEIDQKTIGYQSHNDALKRDSSFNNRHKYDL